MKPKLPAPLALRKFLIEQANDTSWEYNGPLETESEIETAYKDMLSAIGCDVVQDYMCGTWKVDLEIPSSMWSRHCEVELVAIQDDYGNYIGFPRYFGGGKHFDEYAYYDTSIHFAFYLKCEEKEVLTIQRTWSKLEE